MRLRDALFGINEEGDLCPVNVRREAPLLFLALGLFVAFQVGALFFHEPWADEIQAWLLARDSILPELLLTRVRYEPVPGLWHALLWIVLRFSENITLLNVCGSLVATFSCAIILIASPLPLWMRLLLPFSYFFGYQYSIVARNYCLVTLGIIVAAVIYPQRFKHPLAYVVSLLVVANSAAHGILVAAAIAICDIPLTKASWLNRKSLLKLSPVFILGMLVAIAQIYPQPPDSGSLPDVSRFGWKVLLPSIDESLVGVSLLSLPIFIASLWTFYRAKILCTYLLSIVFVEAFFVSTYWMRWHSGLLFLIWVFCVFQCYERKTPLVNSYWWKAVMLVFLVTTVWQTLSSIRYDALYPTSGLKQAARDIKRRRIDVNKIVYLDFFGQMLRGYYPSQPGKPSYWVWTFSISSPWTLESDIFHLGGIRKLFDLPRKDVYPRYILCNDTTPASLIVKAGYQVVGHYPGLMLWRGKTYEKSGYFLIENNPR